MKEVLSELQEGAIKDERTSRFTSTMYVNRVNIFKSFHFSHAKKGAGADPKYRLQLKILRCGTHGFFLGLKLIINLYIKI